jgi:hypothetical protein
VDRRRTGKYPVFVAKSLPAKQWLLIEPISGLPPISDLAQPELRLGGLRFSPRTNGPSRRLYFTGLRLQVLPDGAEKTVAGLPAVVLPSLQTFY